MDPFMIPETSGKKEKSKKPTNKSTHE